MYIKNWYKGVFQNSHFECYMMKFDPMFTTFLQDKIVKILSVKVYTLKHLDSQSSSIGAALCRYEVCRHLLMRGGTHTVLHYARGTQTRGTLCLTVSVQKENCPQCKLVALNVASFSRVSTFCLQRAEGVKDTFQMHNWSFLVDDIFWWKVPLPPCSRENAINLSRWIFQYQHPGQWTQQFGLIHCETQNNLKSSKILW